MPINATTGLYEEPVFSSPGHGVFAALRALNEPISARNYEQNQAAQHLKMLEDLATAPAGDANLDQTPEFQRRMSLAGIDPASASSQLQASPAIAFAKGAAELPEGYSQDALTRLATSTGALPALAATSQMTKLTTGGENVNNKRLDAYRKAKETGLKMFGNEKDAQDYADRTVYLSPQERAGLQTGEAPSGNLADLYASKVNKNDAETNWLTQRTAENAALLDDKKSLLEKQAAVASARASLLQVQKQVLGGQALTPVQKAKMLEQKAALEIHLANLTKPQAGLGGMMPTPMTAGIKAAQKETRATIDGINQILGAAAAGGPAAPGAPPPGAAADPLGLLGATP